MAAPDPTPSHVLDYARPTSRGKRPHPALWPLLIFVALVGVGWFLATALPRMRERGRLKCPSNLKQIGQAMLLYANDHQGRFPDGVEGLLEEDITTAVFVCPSSNDTPAAPGPTTKATAANVLAGGHLSYVYLGKGLTNSVKAEVVLAYEPLSNHQNLGMNVLFGDCHVEWIEIQTARKMLAELNAGHNPPRAEKLK